MNNLKLITTEKFGDLCCDFYRNMNDDILLTREQIGTALEYSNPANAIKNIHRKHKDRLDPLSMKVKNDKGGFQSEPSFQGGLQETYFYTQRGVMEICRWSRQQKANLFMDWVWDIVEKYRNNDLKAIDIKPFVDTLSVLTTTITTMQQDISAMKESTTKKKLPEKKYSRWKTNAFQKLYKLQEYVNTHSDEQLSLPNIIHLVIGETEDTYSIEVNDYVELYKSEMCLENNPYALDVISHYKDIRDMFTLTLDSIMEKLHIGGSRELNKKNIFDILAEEIKKEKEN